MPFKIRQTARGKESNLKKFRIKIYIHTMSTYIIVVLASQEGNAVLRTIDRKRIAYGYGYHTVTMTEVVSEILNQSPLKDFKDAIIEDGGFYFHGELIRMEYLEPSYYADIVNIGNDRYALIPS